MNSTLHVGHHLTQTISSAVGTLPPGSLTVTAAPNGIVGIAIDPPTNNVTLTGVAVGSTVLTYAAVGYGTVTDTVNVSAAPPIIITDGPEV